MLYLKVGSKMIHIVKEYEKQLIEAGTKLYPGDVLFNASGAANFIYELSGHIWNLMRYMKMN